MAEMRRRGRDADVARTKGFDRVGESGRARFVRALDEIQFDPQRWLGQFAGAVSHRDIERALLPREPATPMPTDLPAREVIKRIALDPAYQLK